MILQQITDQANDFQDTSALEPAEKIAKFGPFIVDRNNALLCNKQQPVNLTPKAFSLLCFLLDNANKLVSKQEIFESVWSGVVVGDAALTVCIREIRKALGEKSKNPHYIQTVHKRGYRFNLKKPGQSTVHSETHPQLVGRTNTLNLLKFSFQKATSGCRQLVFITGEAGIGKTALIEKFIEDIINQHDCRIASGQCIEQYGIGEAYLPVLDALSRLCKTHDEEVFRLLAHYAPSWLPHLPEAHSANNNVEPLQSVTATSPEKMMREMAEALEAITQSQPLILILDDLQWADHATIDLLSFLARRKDTAQLMVIGSFRSTEVIISNHPVKNIKQDLLVRGCCTHIPLEYLNQQDINQYLASLFPDHHFPDQLVQFLQHQSNGNPLFLVNILEDLKNIGSVTQLNDNWQFQGNLSELDKYVPDNIQAMISQQIARFSEQHQQLLEVASVACEPGGTAKHFKLYEIASALNIDEITLEKQFEKLLQNCHFVRSLGIFERPNGSASAIYEFTHTLYQNVLYQGIGITRKVRLHLSLGNKLEQLYGTNSIEIAGTLAIHFEIGRGFYKAVLYLLQIAKIASQRGANREAVFTLKRARMLLSKIPQSTQKDELELALLLQLGPAITASQGNGVLEIENCYLRAKQLCEKINDSKKLFQVLFGLRSYYLIKGDFDQSLHLALELFNLAENQNDTSCLLEAHVGLANSYFFSGNIQSSYDHAKLGIKLYNSQQHSNHAVQFGLDPGVFCYSREGQTLWALGYPDKALLSVEEAVKLAKTLNHPYSHVFAMLNLSLVLLYRREGRKALNALSECTAISDTHGFKFLSRWARFLNTWSISLTGDTQTTKHEINERLLELQTEQSITNSYLAVFLAEACWHSKHWDSGSLALKTPKLEHIYDAERLRLQGEFLLRRATETNCISNEVYLQAENLFRNALQISAKQRAKSFELRSAVSLSQLLIISGRDREAFDSLTKTFSFFQEGERTGDIVNAKRIINKNNLIGVT